MTNISLRPLKASTNLYTGCKFVIPEKSKINFDNINTLISYIDDRSCYSLNLLCEMFQHLLHNKHNVNNDILKLYQGKDKLLEDYCNNKLEKLYSKYNNKLSGNILNKIETYLEEMKQNCSDSGSDDTDNMSDGNKNDDWTDVNKRDEDSFDWTSFHKEIKLQDHSPINSEEECSGDDSD